MDQSPVNDVNGRPVSREMLSDKLEVIRAEIKVDSQERRSEVQDMRTELKIEHFKTRILVLIIGLATGIPTLVTKATYILGYFN